MTGLNVQLSSSLYDSLKELADQSGISVEQFVVSAVSEKVADMKKGNYLEAMAKKGNRKDYEAVLAKVPDTQPDTHDQW